MELGDHALRQLSDLARALDFRLREKTFRLRAIESRMHPGDIVEHLRNPHPARQHGDIGNEADIAHELIALGPGISPEHLQFSLIRGEAENRVERGRLAGAVGADESEDAALFDPQIDAVQRDGWAEGLPKTACFYAGHGFNAPPLDSSRATGALRQLSLVPSVSGLVAEWSRRPWAIVRPETSGVRLSATNCVRRL